MSLVDDQAAGVAAAAAAAPAFSSIWCLASCMLLMSSCRFAVGQTNIVACAELSYMVLHDAGHAAAAAHAAHQMLLLPGCCCFGDSRVPCVPGMPTVPADVAGINGFD